MDTQDIERLLHYKSVYRGWLKQAQSTPTFELVLEDNEKEQLLNFPNKECILNSIRLD